MLIPTDGCLSGLIQSHDNDVFSSGSITSKKRPEHKWCRLTARALKAPLDKVKSSQRKHLVSAWASERGLALGQRQVDGKSNEIVAIPELLDTLHLDGCIVTLDAMGCQKDIAARIRAKRADYLLVLKPNHGSGRR